MALSQDDNKDYRRDDVRRRRQVEQPGARVAKAWHRPVRLKSCMAWLIIVSVIVELATARRQLLKNTDFATLHMNGSVAELEACSGVTDGLLVQAAAPHDGTFIPNTDPDTSIWEDSCQVGARKYRYATLDDTQVANSILVVSDWRYTIPPTTDTAVLDLRQTLTFYFTNVNPDPKGDGSGLPNASGQEGVTIALVTAFKLELGKEAHSQWLNLVTPHWGKYLIMQVECGAVGPCYKTWLHYVTLFDQVFYEREDFANHDDAGLIAKYGAGSSVAKSKKQILPKKFRTNCSYYGINTGTEEALHGCPAQYSFIDDYMDIQDPALEYISQPSAIWLKTDNTEGLLIDQVVIVPAIKESGEATFVQRDLDRTSTRVFSVGYALYDTAPNYLDFNEPQDIQITTAWPYYSDTTTATAQGHEDVQWFGEIASNLAASESGGSPYADIHDLAADLINVFSLQTSADSDLLKDEWKTGEYFTLQNLQPTDKVTDLAVLSLPVSQNEYAISGILIKNGEAGVCSTEAQCKDAKCVRFISGNIASMTKGLDAVDEQFTWLIQIPEVCRDRLTIEVTGTGTTNDSLFFQENTSVLQDGSKIAADINIDFLYSRKGIDLRNVRTQTITLKAKFIYTNDDSTQEAVAQVTRTLVQQNPCDSPDFFTEVADPTLPLHTFYHILGVIGASSIQTIDVDPLFPDSVSNLYGSTDHYTYCKSKRKYELLAADPTDPLDKRDDFTLLDLKTDGGLEKFESQISGNLLEEFFFTVTVKASIEIATELVDSYERKIAFYGRTCIKRDEDVASYAVGKKSIQIRQNSWALPKPTYTWQLVFPDHAPYQTLCTGPYNEKLYFIEKDSGGIETVFQTYPEDSSLPGKIPAGVTVDSASLQVTILTTKVMIGDLSYDPPFKSNFFIKHEVENWYSGTSQIGDSPSFDPAQLKRTESQTIEIEITDKCNDPTVASITPFTVAQMQTSVLRVNSEYDTADAASLHDVRQDITNDAVVINNSVTVTDWNNLICGNLIVDVTHDGATVDFATYQYQYLSVSTNHWITLTPILNSQVGTYTMTFTIKFEETDYSAITTDVTLDIEVLPCEIKSTIDDPTDVFENPYMYTFVEDKTALTVNTKKYVFEPKCNYQHEYSLVVIPDPVTHQDAFYNMPSTSDVVTVQSHNLWNRGDYAFKVTLNLTDYASTLGDSIYERSFNVKLVDPCINTKLLASESGLIHLHTLIDHESKPTYPFANYFDEISLREDHDVDGSLIGIQLCGPRQYNIQEVIKHAITGAVINKVDAGEGQYDFVKLDWESSYSTKTLTYHTTKQQNKGSHLIEVQANLQNYTSIKNDTLQFNITYYQLNTDISLNDLKYVLEDEQISVVIPQPLFMPPLHNTPNVTSSNGLGDGAVVFYGIKFRNNDGVVSSIPANILQHDAENTLLTISGDDLDYIGYNKVIIWYDFQDYMNNNKLETDFSLLILPNPKKAPQGGVRPQFDFKSFSPIQNVIFGEHWSIALPATYHPDDTEDKPVQIFYETVDTTAASFVKYDQDQLSLSIEPDETSEQDVGSYQIKMRLQDFRGVYSAWQTITINIRPPPTEQEDVDQAENNSDVSLAEADDVDESIGLKFALQLKEQKEREQLLVTGVNIDDIKTPTASFKSIDNLGQATIVFSQDMRINRKIKEAKQGGTILFEGATEPVRVDEVLKVRLVPFYEAPNDKLGYSWFVQDIGSREIRIKVVFENPLFVSPSFDKDSLQVVFVDGLYFQGPSIKTLESKTTLEKTIPKQSGDLGTKAALQQAAGVLNGGTQITMLANIGINFLQASSLQYLWDMINAQQIVILTPLFYITIPDNAMIFFGWLMQIAAMEAIPTDLIYEQFSQIEGIPMNDKFEEIGFEHHLVLNNFGTLGFVLAILPFLYVLHACTNIFQGIKCCRKFSKKLGTKLYYAIVLRTIMESFVIGLICTFVGLINMDFSRNDNWTYINSIVSIITLVMFGIFPIWGLYFLLKNWQNLHNVNIEGRFGELTEGFNTKDKKMLIFWMLDYVRKLCLALTVTFTLTHLWLQMFVLYMFSIALIIAAGHLDARLSRFDRQMDIFNEAKLIVIMYHLMLFTDFVPDPVTQEQIGFSCSGILIAGTAINMAMLFLSPIRSISRHCRIRGHKKRAKRIAAKKLFKKSAQGFNKRKIEKYKQQQEKVKAQILEIEKIKKDQAEKEQKEKERHERLTELHEKAMEQRKKRAERIADRLHHAGRPTLSEKVDLLNLVDKGDGRNKIAEVNQRLLVGKRPLITDKLKSSEVNNDTQPVDNTETCIEATQMSMADFDTANDLVERNNQDFQSLGLAFSQEESKFLSKPLQRQHSQIAISEENSVQQDDKSSDEDGDKPVIQKLTWDDLDYLWSKFNIGVSDIQTIPGFENFEVTDTEPLGALNIEQLLAQQHPNLALSDKENSDEQPADDDYDAEERSAVWSQDPESNISYDARDFDSNRSHPITEEDHKSQSSISDHHQDRHARKIPLHERNIPLMPSNLALAGPKRRNQVAPHDFQSQGRIDDLDLDIYDADRPSQSSGISNGDQYSLPSFKTLFKSMRDQ